MSPKQVDSERVLARAKLVLEIEAGGVGALGERLGERFVELVELIINSPGKVVISGVGKSGIVGAKLAATFCSTGTPAVTLDPLSAMHGDLGIVASGDVLLAMSNSGETIELLNVAAAARKLGAKIVALTGDLGSTLARESDVALNVGVEREACPLGLAPTASTAALMAFGDALAMALLEERGLTSQDFAVYHPGGSLGNRLKLKVRDIMLAGDQLPRVSPDDTIADAVREMTERGNLGVTLAVNTDGTLGGILTDGDLRDLLRESAGADVRAIRVGDVMTRRPKVIEADAIASEALQVMERHGITSLVIIDQADRPVGMIFLHDILGRGQFTI